MMYPQFMSVHVWVEIYILMIYLFIFIKKIWPNVG